MMNETDIPLVMNWYRRLLRFLMICIMKRNQDKERLRERELMIRMSIELWPTALYAELRALLQTAYELGKENLQSENKVL